MKEVKQIYSNSTIWQQHLASARYTCALSSDSFNFYAVTKYIYFSSEYPLNMLKTELYITLLNILQSSDVQEC